MFFYHGCVCAGQDLYLYGGWDGQTSYNTLHKLSTKTLTWEEIKFKDSEETPMSMSGCGLVAKGTDELVLFGGCGLPTTPSTCRKGKQVHLVTTSCDHSPKNSSLGHRSSTDSTQSVEGRRGSGPRKGNDGVRRGSGVPMGIDGGRRGSGAPKGSDGVRRGSGLPIGIDGGSRGSGAPKRSDGRRKGSGIPKGCEGGSGKPRGCEGERRGSGKPKGSGSDKVRRGSDEKENEKGEKGSGGENGEEIKSGNQDGGEDKRYNGRGEVEGEPSKEEDNDDKLSRKSSKSDDSQKSEESLKDREMLMGGELLKSIDMSLNSSELTNDNKLVNGGLTNMGDKLDDKLSEEKILSDPDLTGEHKKKVEVVLYPVADEPEDDKPSDERLTNGNENLPHGEKNLSEEQLLSVTYIAGEDHPIDVNVLLSGIDRSGDVQLKEETTAGGESPTDGMELAEEHYTIEAAVTVLNDYVRDTEEKSDMTVLNKQWTNELKVFNITAGRYQWRVCTPLDSIFKKIYFGIRTLKFKKFYAGGVEICTKQI